MRRWPTRPCSAPVRRRRRAAARGSRRSTSISNSAPSSAAARSFPGSDTQQQRRRHDARSTAHTGGDIGDSHSWRAGVSVLSAKASDQALLATRRRGHASRRTPSPATRASGSLDGVWKWAPNGNATRTNFKLQGEYLRSTRDGSLVVRLRRRGDCAGAYRAAQSGWYLQGVYQFMPRWRVGPAHRAAGPRHAGLRASTPALLARRPATARRKNSLMLDYSPSEFSRIRLQFARDRAREGAARQPGLPAIPDEPGRAWRAQLLSLKEHTP